MTTSVKNVPFTEEILLFRNQKLPPTPIAVLYAFADCLVTRGVEWLQSEEAKAMTHTINMSVHGRDYRINGKSEQKRLEEVFTEDV
ncbi:MAG TPA: hypothetical protein VHE34_21005 [Puia sp.]|uniref:hypothetical protein n=1 Tax=Puia sp. TaxID=2045100 RepID=UPI002CFFD193|nr:hypothetical protein [Puia sp.]HVU97722.1 hypothetical protein [Puia sp.]